MQTIQRKNTRAFTLMELATVVVITGLIAGSVIKFRGVNNVEVQCYAKTQAQLTRVQAAVDRFAQNKDRFPMPAQRTLDTADKKFGKEAVPGTVTSKDGVSIGAVPTSALGISSEDAIDCWGNKLTYAVSENLTTTTATTFRNDLNGAIKIENAGGQPVLNGAGYVILSHGEDGEGAVKANYENNDLKWCSNDPNKKLKTENCDSDDAIFISAAFNNGKTAGENYFDDLIVQRGKPWNGVVDGVCNNSVLGACITGDVASLVTAACGVPSSWACKGRSGGTDANNCTITTPCAVAGACGTAHGQSFAAEPTTNLCNASSVASAVTLVGTNYTWTCAGSGGGSTAPCSASMGGTVHGKKGGGHGGSFPHDTPPTPGEMCDAGTAVLTTNATSYDWVCVGSGPGATNESGSATRQPAVVDGTPGPANGSSFPYDTPPSSGLCATGTASAVTTTATTYTWTCAGVNGGNPATGTATREPTSKVDGKVGSANGGSFPYDTPPSSGLCEAGTASAVTATETTYSWTCAGSGGGNPATGTATRKPKKVDGKVGSANGGSFPYDTPPSSGLCESGTASAVTATETTYSWACIGSGEGADVMGSATREPKKVDGAVGSAHGGSFPYNTPPSSGLCSAGTASAVTATETTYSWTCAGLNGGNPASGSATREPKPCGGLWSWNGRNWDDFGDPTCSQPSPWRTGSPKTVNCCGGPVREDGEVGSAHGGSFPYDTPPSSGLCNAGTPSAVTAGATTYSWTCYGSNGGNPASGSATRQAKKVDGAVGSAHGGSFPYDTPPSSGLCSAGTASAVTASATTYSWTCAGSGGGNTATGSATRQPAAGVFCLGVLQPPLSAGRGNCPSGIRPPFRVCERGRWECSASGWSWEFGICVKQGNACP